MEIPIIMVIICFTRNAILVWIICLLFVSICFFFGRVHFYSNTHQHKSGMLAIINPDESINIIVSISSNFPILKTKTISTMHECASAEVHDFCEIFVAYTIFHVCVVFSTAQCVICVLWYIFVTFVWCVSFRSEFASCDFAKKNKNIYCLSSVYCVLWTNERA